MAGIVLTSFGPHAFAAWMSAFAAVGTVPQVRWSVLGADQEGRPGAPAPTDEGGMVSLADANELAGGTTRGDDGP